MDSSKKLPTVGDRGQKLRKFADVLNGWSLQFLLKTDLLLFRSSHFSFLVFGHFWRQSYKNTKILCQHCLHFARQDGHDRKKRKENQAIKVTKIPKTKRRKYGINEKWHERNTRIPPSG